MPDQMASSSSSSPPDNIMLRIRKDEDLNSCQCPCSCGAKRLIWPAFLVILTVVLGVLAINSQMVSKEQRSRQKAFEKGHKFLSKIGELYLEDYYFLSSIAAQYDLNQLEMSTTLINKTMDLPKTRNFYKASVRHLHKAAPNLKEVDLISGYLWNLGKNEKVTKSLLKSELEYLKSTLVVVKDAFTEANITIRQYTFDAVFAMDRDEADTSDYQHLLWDQFGYPVDRISAYYMRFSIPIRIQKIEVLLNLSFEQTYKTMKAEGRSRFLNSPGHGDKKLDGLKFEHVELKPFV